MKNTTCQTYENILGNLKKIGIGRGHIGKFLPFWWTPELRSEESASFDAAYTISQKLNVSMMELVKNNGNLVFSPNAMLFIKSSNKTNEDVRFPAAIMSYIAHSISSQSKKCTIQSSASEIRKRILQESRWVDFYALLDYCWSIGIPVFHISKFPVSSYAGWKHPDAATINCNGNYVIFLCKKNTSQSQYLFELAHELGHIVCGHCNEKTLHMDDFTSASDDGTKIEQEANAFAEHLLGSISIGKSYSPSRMAENANKVGAEKKVDPGHIILHTIHEKIEKSPFGHKALKILEQNPANSTPSDYLVSMINKKAFANLRIDEIDQDAFSLLSDMTGIVKE